MAVSTETRAQLHERAHGCCEICGDWGANNAHHRLNQSQGGPDTLGNLMLLCGSGTTGCHGYVTEHPQDAIDNGWTIPSWIRHPPSAVKVLRFDRMIGAKSVVLLTDDGFIEAA